MLGSIINPCQTAAHDPASARHELQTFPRHPAQRATYSLDTKDDANRAGGFKPGFNVAELGRSHPAGRPIMPEFLDDYLASDQDRNGEPACSTIFRLQAHKRSILNRPGLHKCREIAKPSGCENRNMMVDAETDGLKCERSTPTCKDDGFRFPMMRASVKLGCDASRKNLQLPAANTKRRAVGQKQSDAANSAV